MKNIDDELARTDSNNMTSTDNYDNCTTNLPGLNKNLFIEDEITLNDINKFKGRDERNILPSFSTTNKSTSKQFEETEYKTQSLKTKSKNSEYPHLMHINGIVVSPTPDRSNF
jgi:hypothetical protein